MPRKRLILIFAISIFFIHSCTTAIKTPPNSVEERGWITRCALENIAGNSHNGALPRNIALVTGFPGKTIYRSGALEKEFIPTLKNLGIDTIVTLSSVSQETQEAIRAADIVHIEHRFSAKNMTAEKARQAARSIEHASGNVLVHCKAGADRTGLAIAALRIRYGERDEKKIIREMRQYCHLTEGKFYFYVTIVRELLRNP